MRIPAAHTKLWEYLEKTGALNGSEQDIINARKEYRKQYLKGYKQSRRKQGLEIVITLSEAEKIMQQQAAKKHNLSLPKWLRQSSLAYQRQVYIAPNRMQVARLEQGIAACLNEIQAIGRSNKNNWFSQQWKYDQLEERIKLLQTIITQTLRFPDKQDDPEDQIQKDSQL